MLCAASALASPKLEGREMAGASPKEGMKLRRRLKHLQAESWGY